MHVNDKISINSSIIDLRAKFDFKFYNVTKKNLRLLEQVNDVDDSDDLKVQDINHLGLS